MKDKKIPLFLPRDPSHQELFSPKALRIPEAIEPRPLVDPRYRVEGPEYPRTLPELEVAIRVHQGLSPRPKPGFVSASTVHKIGR